jgi:MYXO-CTERM domain-containing protein
MKRPLALLFPVTAALALSTHAPDAAACGGCFVQQSESTQVTGHRMILSVSSQSTTLWDQITYSGAPESFAWVLPIKGTVDIELSSDALFQALEDLTAVTVSSPTIQCPPPPDCGGDFANAGSSTGAGGAEDGGVEVLAEEVVGPYETVQLATDDPAALDNWLASHNYAVPPEIAPTLAAYVAEGFNFLALKLVPGQGIDSMRPIRVTTPGAGGELPLRMVAAGTGATTPISLWVMAEGRYEPQNFPSFEIGADKLVWNWDTASSNYKDLRAAGFDATGGLGWLLEAGEPFSSYSLEYSLVDLAQYDPKASGYGDENGVGAVEEAQADIAALLGGMEPNATWISRMYAELPRVALGTDLAVTASANQSPIQRYFEATATLGTPPACQEFPPCDDGIGPSGSGATTTAVGGCAASPSSPDAGLGAAAIAALGLLLAKRRRRAA